MKPRLPFPYVHPDAESRALVLPVVPPRGFPTMIPRQRPSGIMVTWLRGLWPSWPHVETVLDPPILLDHEPTTSPHCLTVGVAASRVTIESVAVCAMSGVWLFARAACGEESQPQTNLWATPAPEALTRSPSPL